MKLWAVGHDVPGDREYSYIYKLHGIATTKREARVMAKKLCTQIGDREWKLKVKSRDYCLWQTFYGDEVSIRSYTPGALIPYA